MTRWQELCQKTLADVEGVARPELDAETRTIWILMAALSDAFWRRVNETGFSVVEKIGRNAEAYHPESEDEVALWNELTAPHNYSSLIRYVALCNDNEYVGGALATARHRWESRAEAS